MSGAVGAICRQRKVLSAKPRRVNGGVGRYLNMSFNGWPLWTKNVRVHGRRFEELASVVLSVGDDVEVERRI